MNNLLSVVLIVFGVALVAGGCSSKSDLQKVLVGRWKTISLHVTIHTYNGTDSTMVIDFDEEDLNTRFPTKPVETTLNEDGTYFTEFRSRTDSLIARPTGEWSLANDTLTMHQLVPTPYTYLYHIRMVNDQVEFRIMTDYDRDGATDDEMVSVSRRIATP